MKKEGRSSSRIKAVLLPDRTGENRIDSFRRPSTCVWPGRGTAQCVGKHCRRSRPIAVQKAFLTSTAVGDGTRRSGSKTDGLQLRREVKVGRFFSCLPNTTKLF